jgi:prolyl-tRNA editing enzyme YbaK/EbsC (Cys-tRNA(Pro) deacylase)
MAKKDKGIPKTLPMRALDEKGIPYQVHEQSHKQTTSAGVAEELGVPIAQVVKAMIVLAFGEAT